MAARVYRPIERIDIVRSGCSRHLVRRDDRPGARNYMTLHAKEVT